MDSPTTDIATEARSAPLLVACLCADWCHICRDYQPQMAAALAGFGPEQVSVVWVDIEDHDAVVGDLDVQNFPTLLMARGGLPVFFGTLTPHPQTLVRLVQGALAGDVAELPHNGELLALAARVQAFHAAQS